MLKSLSYYSILCQKGSKKSRIGKSAKNYRILDKLSAATFCKPNTPMAAIPEVRWSFTWCPTSQYANWSKFSKIYIGSCGEKFRLFNRFD